MNRRDRRRAGAQRRRSMKQFYDDIYNDIRRDGRSVLCIGGEEDSLPFAYTIGNALKGLPELLMIGGIAGAYLLNVLSEQIVERNGGFDDGELISLGGKFPVKIINATDTRARSEYTIQAGQAIGHENYAVQQVLIADKSGRYPDDPECAAPYSSVPVLHARH